MDIDILHKAQFLVEITNRITKVERLMFNVMLLEIKEIIQDQDTYKMSLATLQSRMGKDFKPKYDRIKKMLLKISDTKIDYLIFNEKGKEVGFQRTQLLVEPSLENGIIQWSYGPFMREQLAKNSAFAQLDLEIQKKFLTKHALALWEWFSMSRGFLNEGKKDISMGEKTVEEIKKLLGVEGKWTQWMIFNRDVIKPSINEINTYSDLHVTVTFRKKQKKVVAMTFIVNLKAKEVIKKPLLEDQSVFQTLIRIGIAERSAEQFIEKFSEEDIRKALKYYQNYSNEIKDLNAWMNRCLTEKWWFTADKNKKTGIPSLKLWWRSLTQNERGIHASAYWKDHPDDKECKKPTWKIFQQALYEKALQPELFL